MNKFLTTSNWNNPKFNKIIDVRSPNEFKNDHLIGSINCPVLSDSEREYIGIIYKKDSPFRAKIIGSTIIVLDFLLLSPILSFSDIILIDEFFTF